MKKIRSFCILLAVLWLGGIARAQVTLPFYDGFSYTAGGNLAGNGNWVSGTGSGTVMVNAGSLSYTGLAASSGNDVTVIPGSSSARTYLNFTAQSSGTVYFSFLLKVNTAPTAQRLIAYAYSSTSSSSTPYLGIFITTSGQVAVGIGTSSPQFTSSGLTVGSVNLVVIAYTFASGGDSAQIWINPASLGGSAPATTGNFTATHNSSLAYFHWNTPSASPGGGSYEVDEFRIAATYALVTPTGGGVTPPATNAPVITRITPQVGSAVLQGTNGNASASYVVLTTTNPAAPAWQWAGIATNTYDTNGNFLTTNPTSPSAPRTFYRLLNGTNLPSGPSAPSLSAQPQNQTIAAGQSALFSVTAGGTAPLAYQWFYNTNTPLAGNTNATLTLSNVQTNQAGLYSVTVTNAYGSTNSAYATLTVNPAGSSTNLTPVNGALNVNVDAQLQVSFSTTPTLGTSGLVRIYNAANNSLVDTLDVSSVTNTRSIGGTTYTYYPVLISGKTAYLTLHANLSYGQSYYVTADASVFQNAGTWAGITDTNTWRFSTKAAAPSTSVTNIVVAADGTGDFNTVQGAIDFVPSGNSTFRTITIRNGIYREMLNLANRNNLKFAGETRGQAVITYANNICLNSSSRYMARITADDISLVNLVLSNSTPQSYCGSASQAETIRVDGSRFGVWNSEFYSLQDTILINNAGGSGYFQDSLVAGNVDYVWGSATIYFTNCEIRSVYRGSSPNGYIAQPRNPAGQNGFAFVDCQLTGSGGAFTTQYFARNNKNDANPACQMALINCRISTGNFNAAGWLLDGSSSTAGIRFWEYQSTDLTGTNLVNVSSRPAWSVQLDATQAAAVRSVTNWFGGWQPVLP